MSKSWVKSGPLEETGNVAENGPFLVAIGVRNWVSEENDTLSRILPQFRKNPGHSIHLSPEITLFVSNHGEELAEFRIKSGPQEEAGNVAGGGPILIAIRAQNVESSENDRLPMVLPKFWQILANPFVSANSLLIDNYG